MGAFWDVSSALRLPWRAVGDASLVLVRALASGIAQARDRVAHMHARSRQRVRLHELDAHLLRDIGLTQELAEREARRPFWV